MFPSLSKREPIESHRVYLSRAGGQKLGTRKMQECAREEADWNNNAAKQTHMNEKVHVCGPGMFP